MAIIFPSRGEAEKKEPAKVTSASYLNPYLNGSRLLHTRICVAQQPKYLAIIAIAFWHLRSPIRCSRHSPALRKGLQLKTIPKGVRGTATPRRACKSITRLTINPHCSHSRHGL